MNVGGRGCKERYEVIERYVETMPGPIKVLDIGANMGYFSFRLAERFYGNFVMVENSPSTVNRLIQLCLMNANPQISFLACRVNLAKLEKLLIEEQFDLIIALSVIHHFEEPFNDIVKVMASHSKHVILEHASPEEKNCPHANRVKTEPLDLSPYAPQKLISTPATGYQTVFRDVWALQGTASSLRQAPEGLSFQTYKEYSGLYPHPSHIDQQVKKNKKREARRLVKGKLIF